MWFAFLLNLFLCPIFGIRKHSVSSLSILVRLQKGNVARENDSCLTDYDRLCKSVIDVQGIMFKTRVCVCRCVRVVEKKPVAGRQIIGLFPKNSRG